jgi:hypothetical protein
MGAMGNNRKRSTKRKPESGLPYLLAGGLIFCATLALVIFGHLESSGPAYVALSAGAALGTWLFRFGSRHAWISLVCLFGSLMVFVILAANSDAFGSAGIAWFGSFVAGTNVGAAWRIAANRPTARAAEAEWSVNGKRLGTAPMAREAASDALNALDGDARWRLSVEHGSARFEVAGDASQGLVCHRNPLGSRDEPWWVLDRGSHPGDDVVEVPMGEMKPSLPLRLVHDLATVNVALDDFLKNPESISLGREWTAGNLASGTRLSMS